MDPEKREVLERQGYRIVGEHSGVKLCHWTKASLTKGIGCYKQTFYGIESHRCLQMTPAVLRRMHSEGRLPTQLYVTVAAPNAEIYRRLVAAKSDNEWRKLKETLALLPTLPTRTVVRHTLVEGWNLGWEDEYAELDRIARPMFIECKGYSFVGESRLRLQAENVPSHASIRTFAGRLADRVGYRIAAEREDSRVVLLTQDGALHPISP